MKAVILKQTGPPSEVIALTPDAPTPKRAPGDILVRVIASAVNPVEYKTVRGMLPAKVPKVRGRERERGERDGGGGAEVGEAGADAGIDEKNSRKIAGGARPRPPPACPLRRPSRAAAGGRPRWRPPRPPRSPPCRPGHPLGCKHGQQDALPALPATTRAGAGLSRALSLLHPHTRLAPPLQILAGDVAGIVVEADPDGPFQPGTPVFAMTDGFKWDVDEHGCWAEYVSFPAAWAAAAPSSIPLADAAALPLVALTAYQTLALAPNLKKVEEGGSGPAAPPRILVHAGAGGVGHVGVQLARALYGAEVTSTAGPANQAFLKAEPLGVDEAVDYKAVSPDEFAKSHAGAFDAILDVVGGAQGEATAGALLKLGGTYCHVFNTATDGETTAKVKAALEAEGKAYVGPTLVSPDGPALAAIAALVDAGKLKPIIASRVALDGVAAALEEVEAGHVRGKIVVEVAKE